MENEYNVDKRDVSKWNWGAFMMPVIWGFGNKSYLPLLTLIPVFGFIWVFIVGAKANQWAWQNNQYRDVEEFTRVQETWNRAGFVIILLYIIAFILFFVFFGSIAATYQYFQSSQQLTY